MTFHPENPYNELPLLPPEIDVETKGILRQLAQANRALAELKGIVSTIPNETIIINTLALQEAKDSSEVENIITTQDELYKAALLTDDFDSPAAKEVYRYAEALKAGFNMVRNNKLLTTNIILEIQSRLERNSAGIRKVPGTALINETTGEKIYTPPSDPGSIHQLLKNLDTYINYDELHQVDPLIKMAIIHYQFESIHPFYDGNGRTGRIINILYLVIKDLLKLPVLYLSRYIIANKPEYYRLLQRVRTEEDWHSWILYILKGVEITANDTIRLVISIKEIMMDYKHRIREKFPKMYSQDLINNLFKHPYTKIEFLMKDLNVARMTAAKYLDTLTENGFLDKRKIGRSNFYINIPLLALFVK